MKLYNIFFLLFLTAYSFGQQVYRTEIFDDNIKSLFALNPQKNDALPVISLNGSERIQIHFDELSHNQHAYSYKIIHCNADWTASNINSGEYLAGFTTDQITDWNLSVNTTLRYTHYTFSLPNDNIQFKISGNYVVQIYEDNNTDNPIANVCFCILDPRIDIQARIRGNTDTELSNRMQQLDFDLNLNGIQLRDPNVEIKTVVRQNNRLDNQVLMLKPTYINANKLSYINNRELIFEGGSEYHRFDISSVYGGGEGVDKIRFDQTIYHALLMPNKIKNSNDYTQELDVNGRFRIHLQNSDYQDVEADYMLVHFTLPSKKVFFDGMLYVGGEFNYNLFNNKNRMSYDAQNECYTLSVLLKQGGYNFQYWFVPKASKKASTERVEGSNWQTRNEYTIYVYMRALGDRYDKLIGLETVQN